MVFVVLAIKAKITLMAETSIESKKCERKIERPPIGRAHTTVMIQLGKVLHTESSSERVGTVASTLPQPH